jgi:hypothetical protein
LTSRSEAEWNELATEGRRFLEQVARDQSLTDYGVFNKELAEATGLPPFNLNSEEGRAGISRLLVLVAELDWEDGKDFMLTSLVKLSGENYPGKGFFTLAKQEGLYDGVEPEMDFWSRQVGLAHSAHRRVRPGRG